MTTNQIVTRVWSFCNILLDDGVSYLDYLEQLTFLLFLKMADEYSKPPYNREIGIPKKFTWETLTTKKGAALEAHYSILLKELGSRPGMIGQIFTKSQNKIQDPAKLSKLISMIDDEKWVIMGADVKGDIYEGLLSKNAEEGGKGAGQYFTPRSLIKAMVACVQPKPMKTVLDPSCGTGGFFLATYDYITQNYKLDKGQKEFLKFSTFRGNEIVASTRRLCLMNLFLHNVGEMTQQSIMISPNDTLVSDPGDRFDYVLANPPFGRKSSMTITNEAGEQEKEELTYNRQDFWVSTSNKQLNFLQHIKTVLKPTGQAAVVLPDNVLFEGGPGEVIRRKLLETSDLHTILRLPTGIFYANGVKANVLFFDNKPASKNPQTKEVWVYDYRTNIRHTLKTKSMKFDDLGDFIKCYNPDNRSKRIETWSEQNPEGRWRKFSYKELTVSDKCSLDLSWLKDNTIIDFDNLPEPDVIASDIVVELEKLISQFKAVQAQLDS